MTGRQELPKGKPHGDVVALCGGVGGAKLALGLSRVVPGDQLSIGVNTGDDFKHLGLHISPDIDTVMYTLAGLANPETGWGRVDETWNFMETLSSLGGETWFQLGDRDMALHVERTCRLRAGETLSAITADICSRLGIASRVLPMSDDPVRTLVETETGPMPFQNYFVEQRCKPAVRSVTFAGAERATTQRELAAALLKPNLRAVVICPSNPYLSVDPILAVAGMRELLHKVCAPVVAVSPVVGGKAVKGPMAKIMGELGHKVSHATIANHYAGLIEGLMVDCEEEGIPGNISVAVQSTMMKTLDDKIELARAALSFADDITAGRGTLQEQRA